jgi:hypothetical protein
MDELLKAASLMHQARMFLHAVLPKLDGIDKRACYDIVSDLRWGAENCMVMHHHQNGEKLDDTMGYTAECINCHGKRRWYVEDQVVTCSACCDEKGDPKKTSTTSYVVIDESDLEQF